MEDYITHKATLQYFNMFGKFNGFDMYTLSLMDAMNFSNMLISHMTTQIYNKLVDEGKVELVVDLNGNMIYRTINDQ